MRFFQYSEKGDHLQNEDVISVYPPDFNPSFLICALADGMGGQTGGAEASYNAVALCQEKAKSFNPNQLADPFVWLEIGGQIDLSISQIPDAGYTTFIGTFITAGFITGVSSGDSAAAITVDNKLFVLTQNQSKNPPFGSGIARLTPFSAVLAKQCRIIIMSDGVWKYAGWEAVTNRCLSEAGESLIANLRSDVLENTKILIDDFSVILIET